MKQKTFLVSLVAAVFALAVFSMAGVSAFGDITSIEVNGVEVVDTTGAVNIGSFAGQDMPVRITFLADDDVTDVRVKAWIAGEREYSVSSERFKVFNGSTYSRTVSVQMPFDIDPQEDLKLMVSVESKREGSVEKTIDLAGQRESYIVEVLDVVMEPSVKAGENLALDVVLKNRGLEFAEDTFVRAKISALGVEDRAYFGDLSPVDQDEPTEKDDAAERRMFLNIPSSAKPGVYVVELEAYNGDSSTTLTKKVAVVGAGDDSKIVSALNSKTFAVGEKSSYSLTLVNSGNKVRVYELVVESSGEDLDVSTEEPILVVPAGSSRTVKVDAMALKAGKYNFAVNVNSEGELVGKESYTANVEGTKSRIVAGGTNTTVLLTVILAIVFVVLLVVLIVLLTRKPEKNKEFGESYY